MKTLTPQAKPVLDAGSPFCLCGWFVASAEEARVR
jgi:hypothetical protein